MAAGSLLALLDDIATILDDVSVMTQVAAKKTAGVLGDDLALNAQQVTGVSAERELPVVWAVAKGSFINKLILVPSALLISFFAPKLITPLLMIGGIFLCFEGTEKIAHKFLPSVHEDDAHHQALKHALKDVQIDLVMLEREKIQGAIRTDFILSAEIIVIALGTVATAAMSKQIAVLASIGILMTIGVYGLVAAIVKMDDFGLYLLQRQGDSYIKQMIRKWGQCILSAMPWFMRALTVLGTAAMFLVGGAIFAHGIPTVHHWIEPFANWSWILNGLLGLVIGAVSLMVWILANKMLVKKARR